MIGKKELIERIEYLEQRIKGLTCTVEGMGYDIQYHKDEINAIWNEIAGGLLPCPYCGGEAIVVVTKTCGELKYAKCLKCETRTKEYSYLNDAINAWNKRAGGKNETDKT